MSFFFAPAANNARIKRSTETAGSLASILVTRDWLERRRFASSLCESPWLVRHFFKLVAESQFEFYEGRFFIRQAEELSRGADLPSACFKLLPRARLHGPSFSMILLLHSVSDGACNCLQRIDRINKIHKIHFRSICRKNRIQKRAFRFVFTELALDLNRRAKVY